LCGSSNRILLFQNSLSYSITCALPILELAHRCIKKNLGEILTGITSIRDKNDTFTIASLPIHKHGISLHYIGLLWLFSLSFWSFLYRPSTCFINYVIFCYNCKWYF
jgi:hypothetical protein